MQNDADIALPRLCLGFGVSGGRRLAKLAIGIKSHQISTPSGVLKMHAYWQMNAIFHLFRVIRLLAIVNVL